MKRNKSLEPLALVVLPSPLLPSTERSFADQRSFCNTTQACKYDTVNCSWTLNRGAQSHEI